MAAESSESADRVLQELINRALTGGVPPGGASLVGPMTQAAIAAVAQHHPDATADHIIAVYDAYAAEQGRGGHAPERSQRSGDGRSAHSRLRGQRRARYPAGDRLSEQSSRRLTRGVT